MKPSAILPPGLEHPPHLSQASYGIRPDGGGNKAVAPIAGTYVIGANLAWRQNGTNLPTDMRARLLQGASTVAHGPVQTKTLTEGVITLEFATMLQLAASDEIRLQIWFSGADGYAAQNPHRRVGGISSVDHSLLPPRTSKRLLLRQIEENDSHAVPEQSAPPCYVAPRSNNRRMAFERPRTAPTRA